MWELLSVELYLDQWVGFYKWQVLLVSGEEGVLSNMNLCDN